MSFDPATHDQQFHDSLIEALAQAPMPRTAKIATGGNIGLVGLAVAGLWWHMQQPAHPDALAALSAQSTQIEALSELVAANAAAQERRADRQRAESRELHKAVGELVGELRAWRQTR